MPVGDSFAVIPNAVHLNAVAPVCQLAYSGKRKYGSVDLRASRPAPKRAFIQVMPLTWIRPFCPSWTVKAARTFAHLALPSCPSLPVAR